MAESVPRPTDLGGQNGLSPAAATRGYFKTLEHLVVSGVSKVTVLQNPAHGTLEDLGTLAYDQFGKVTRDTGERSYVYHAKTGYVGQDSTTLLVEMGGYQVKVTNFFHVFAEVIYNDTPLMEQYCPNGYYWKISSTLDSDGTNTLTSVEYQSAIIDAGATTTDTATQASTLSTSVMSTLSVDPSLVTAKPWATPSPWTSTPPATTGTSTPLMELLANRLARQATTG